ncbi:hypothetical protein [Tissierella sp.]|uniref:hypothetical protein n=1 Tax=Tissierella sp. TaxID=41274 RepID=UPI00285A6C19|nr:hypothetical protein [Tissierella sp.]MDR7857235.1 hypothetical protein [Tissierella sp.]
MNIDKYLVCPKCNGVHFEVKREATFLYSYKLNTPLTNELSWETDVLPFLFDNREQLNSKEYIICEECGAKYPCDLNSNNTKFQFTILQKSIRSDLVQNPEFLG